MRRFLYHIMLIAAVSVCTVQASAQGGADADMGIPFFENFTASQYNAHNRNFDVICDGKGHTFFANFEGLLVFDNVEWKIVHTPDISRVTGVSIDDAGNVRFDGVTFKGLVESVDGDSIRVSYTRNDVNNAQVVEGQRAGNDNEVDRWNEIEVYQRLKLSDNRILLATATDGVIAVNAQGREIWRVNVDNGLCSNSITKLSYDGKGTVWGATDNGVFRLSVQEIYTHFTEKEGLRGQVSCIARSGGSLIVGTFQGLYRLEGRRFYQVNNVSHACWQIQQGPGDILYVATQNGVYEYSNGQARQLTKPFTLSVMAMEDGTYLAGELERICLYRGQDEVRVVGDIPNITRFKKDGSRGLWAMTLSGEYYYMESGTDRFEKRSEGPISKLFEYEDYEGNLWQCYDNGLGLRQENMTDALKERIEPFRGYSVQAMFKDGGIVWIADNKNLVRFNMERSLNEALYQPQLYIREFNLNGQDLNLSFSNDKYDAIGQSQYSYRLHDDGEWSRWNEQQQYMFANLSYGNYEVSVRSIDAFGQVSETSPVQFRIPLPFYMRWYAILVYFFIVVFAVFQWFKIRMRHLQKEQQRLEAIVEERTKEVVKQKDEIEAQKDEIEEKSHKLEETLGELRSAQDKLLRQEREAAIGKLTKGLIDRILNPMNYINNFAHLTLGLSKEMRDNIEDEKDNITPDTYEDSVDVMDMMKTNLEKIEQHGISTTRTLKAMEEMLKERSRKIEPTDVALLCQQCIDKFNNYYTDDIRALGIQVECVRPESPLMLEVVAEQLNKSIMSMLSNSIYAIKKKAEKGGEYKPLIKVTVQAASGENGNSILIYDNGIGIEKSIIDKIFDPFFTTKPTAEAPGVGLYLSQQVLHDWGGSITVDSVKDEYTEFKIIFA